MHNNSKGKSVMTGGCSGVERGTWMRIRVQTWDADVDVHMMDTEVKCAQQTSRTMCSGRETWLLRERFKWVKSEQQLPGTFQNKKNNTQQIWVFQVEQHFREVSVLTPSKVTHLNLSPNYWGTQQVREQGSEAIQRSHVCHQIAPAPFQIWWTGVSSGGNWVHSSLCRLVSLRVYTYQFLACLFNHHAFHQ